MILRRIFAGSMAVLVLSVSALAAACDVSCAFASMISDCHSEQTVSQDAAPGGMKMDGMAMAGMTMPEMADAQSQQSGFAILQANAGHHPTIGEMGPCERQGCDNNSAVSATSRRSGNSHFHSVLAATETPHADSALPLIRGARDAIAPDPVRDASPLHLGLRI